MIGYIIIDLLCLCICWLFVACFFTLVFVGYFTVNSLVCCYDVCLFVCLFACLVVLVFVCLFVCMLVCYLVMQMYM